MFTAYIVVTIFAAAANTYAAIVDFRRPQWVLDNITKWGGSHSWLFPLGALKGAGALGLLVGIGVPLIGIAAAVGLVLFFVGAITVVIRARWYSHLRWPVLVDPLGANPLVICGSANFSEASTTNNDENMLIIRGNPRVADIYLGEFMRLYRHFAFRDWLTQHPEADEVQVSHLDETDQWWKRYFGDSFESRQRIYFAS